MRRRVVVAAVLSLVLPAVLAGQQESPAPLDSTMYAVYTARGEPVSLNDVLNAAAASAVVFLGESHNDRVGHALQHEIFSRLLALAGPAEPGEGGLVLSLEMFERDVQYIVDEYLSGLITADQFRRSSRPWPHYEEDYSPVVEAAREAGVPVLAANAPRRYVNLVGREGPTALSGLSAEALRHLPPLPFAGPSDAYVAELRGVMGSHGNGAGEVSPAMTNGLLAQALWDATMAYSIAETLLRRPGARVVHLVGSFHVRNGTGIPEHLERYLPGTRQLTIFIDPVEDIAAFPETAAGAGDYVILTDRARVRPADPPAGG
jgi:uncharacterized iron-regulated protein